MVYVLYGPHLDLDYLRMMDPDCGRFGHMDCFGEPLPANVTEWKEARRASAAPERALSLAGCSA